MFEREPIMMMKIISKFCKDGSMISYTAYYSMYNEKHLIENAPKEKIRDELSRILISLRPTQGIELMRTTGLLQYVLPELLECRGLGERDEGHGNDVYSHILRTVENTPRSLILRLAALLHDIGKPAAYKIDDTGRPSFTGHHFKSAFIARDVLTKLKYHYNTVGRVCILVQEHMSRFPKVRGKSVEQLVFDVGDENIDLLLALQEADIKACGGSPGDFHQLNVLREEIGNELFKQRGEV